MNVSFEALKLKAQLENLVRTPTIENANFLLTQIRHLKNENFQFIQDVFLTNLLKLMDKADGLKKNEMKSVLLQCIVLIIRGSRLKKELPYRTILTVTLKQIFDFQSNSYKSNLSEELKLGAFDCFATASSHLDPEAAEEFMVEDNKIILGQSIFVCKEAIEKEKYLKIRKTAIDALTSLLQLHDKSDSNDIVLRDQTSKIVFFILPQISATLIKTCQEETVKSPSLVQAAVKTLGRYLCLIFQDYEKRLSTAITSKDFQNLTIGIKDNEDDAAILKPANQSQAEYLMNLKKSSEWLTAASKKLFPALKQIKSLAGCEHPTIRYELAVLAANLLEKCLINVRCMLSFLVEILVTLADDSEEKTREFTKKSMKRISKIVPELDNEICEIFTSHLTVMPRVVMTGDDSEQVAGFTLLNSVILLNSKILENSVLLEKFMNVMLSCCELNVPNDLLFYENLASGSLDDKFYNMKTPWKQFKNLRETKVVTKFSEICGNIGKSDISEVCVNFLMDNMSSIEHLVLMNEILKNSSKISQDQMEGIVEEFLSDTYWTMKIRAESLTRRRKMNEDWYQESTPGLYESAMEVKVRDVALDDEDEEINALNLKSIKYNILCTCYVLELVGTAAIRLGENFQRFLLRTLHRVLEKAGNSNFIIRSAGLHALESISTAMGCSEVSELVDINSDYLLFNIQRQLRRDHENDAILDMIAVIFKFSKSSLTLHIKDIVETATEQLTFSKFTKNTPAYLKLFQLYAGSVRQWEKEIMAESGQEDKIEATWDEFLEQCLFELGKTPEEDILDQESPPDAEDSEDPPPEPEEEQQPTQLPPHIELIKKILTSSLQFFASKDPSEVILVHEIFIESLPVLKTYEDQLLPMVHEVWYPFTKQFQVKNLLVLQFSFRLLSMIARFAKDFVNKRSTDDVIPVVNKFLEQSHKSTSANLSYTQEFKLQREILTGYGELLVNLDIDERNLDKILDILVKYEGCQNSALNSAVNKSIEALKRFNPGLVHLKMKYR